MDRTCLQRRRSLLLSMAVVGLAPIAGCMSKPIHPANADGTYCHRNGRGFGQKLTCTPTAVPTEAAEAEAKRFEADPASLTVYVLRRRWSDAGIVVPVVVDGVADAATTPESLVRLRLKPGPHRLVAHWDGQATDTLVEGLAGDLRIVELVGSGWAWGTRFNWQAASGDGAKARAMASKLVADLDLRK